MKAESKFNDGKREFTRDDMIGFAEGYAESLKGKVLRVSGVAFELQRENIELTEALIEIRALSFGTDDVTKVTWEIADKALNTMKKKVIITMLIEAEQEKDLTDFIVEFSNYYRNKRFGVGGSANPFQVTAWNTELTKKEIETLME